MSAVYLIKNITNGKKYVGSTNNYRRRMLEHLSDLRRNKHHNQHLQNVFNKDSQELEFELLVDGLEHNVAQIIEQAYLNIYDLCNNGYNIRSDVFYSPKSEIISNAIKNSNRIKRKRQYYERPHLKGVNGTNAKQIAQYNINGELIKEWWGFSITQVANEMNTTQRNLSNCLRGFTKTAIGYKWTYLQIEKEVNHG